MILVTKDRKGLELVLGEMLEHDYDHFRLRPQIEGKDVEHQARLLASVAQVTLSPGYERWARHLMLLARYHKLGLPLGTLLADEVMGLEVLDQARQEHKAKHPECFSCGMPQPNKFQMECVDCGAKYRRKGR